MFGGFGVSYSFKFIVFYVEVSGGDSYVFMFNGLGCLVLESHSICGVSLEITVYI